MRIALTHNLARASDHEVENDAPETIAFLTTILGELGHAVVPVDVTCSVRALVDRLRRAAPDLVFNLAEGRRGAFREAFYPALFEELGLAHTGSSASALAVCLDKALAKRIVAAAGVATPRDRLIRDPSELGDHALPVIVKPNFEGSSIGITQASIVEDARSLRGVVEVMLDRHPDGVVVEDFIEGADVSVAWVAGLGVLAPIGFAYEPTGRYHILDRTLKQDPGRVRVEIPPAIDVDACASLIDAATQTFVVLGIEGYGRADFRVTPEGKPWFLEMNPLPTLAPSDEDLYAAAAWIGKTPHDLLEAIVAATDMRSDHLRLRRAVGSADEPPAGRKAATRARNSSAPRSARDQGGA